MLLSTLYYTILFNISQYDTTLLVVRHYLEIFAWFRLLWVVELRAFFEHPRLRWCSRLFLVVWQKMPFSTFHVTASWCDSLALMPSHIHLWKLFNYIQLDLVRHTLILRVNHWWNYEYFIAKCLPDSFIVMKKLINTLKTIDYYLYRPDWNDWLKYLYLSHISLLIFHWNNFWFLNGEILQYFLVNWFLFSCFFTFWDKFFYLKNKASVFLI